MLADVCTGSSGIATSLLYTMKQARAVATDISPDALAVARLNAIRHGVIDRLEFLQGDMLGPLLENPTTRANESLHYLVSNPPYIPDHEWEAVEPNVKDHEPHVALRGGVDGMVYVTQLIENGPPLLRPGGLLLIELASCNCERAKAIAEAHPMLEGARILSDIDNLPRVLVASRRPIG